MEATETTEATTTEVTTPTTESAAPQVEASSDAVNDNSSIEAAPTTPAAPAYKPDYKLKVYDEEKELDDPFLKALIKDAESEKKVKEIAQKYLGFDTVKERIEKTKNDFQTYQQQTQPIVDLYSQYAKAAQKGDLEGIFQLLNISDDVIFKYAVQKAEMSPEQRAYAERQRQVQSEKEYLESQNQTLLTERQRQLSEFRAQELQWVMARPEVHSVSSAYDAKNGPGAFRQFVRKVALAHYAETKGQEDLSAEQAVQEAMKVVGGFVTPTNLNAGQAPQQTLIPQTGGQPPIIPNASGRGVSPVRKQVKSISDLKKRSEELGDSSL